MSKNRKGKTKKKGDNLDDILAEFGINEKKEDEVEVENEKDLSKELENEENKEVKISKSKKKKEKLKQKKEQAKNENKTGEEQTPEKVKEPEEQKNEKERERDGEGDVEVEAEGEEEEGGEEAEGKQSKGKPKKKKKKKEKEKAGGISEIAKAAAERLRLLKEYEQKKKEEEERLRKEEEERIKKEEEEKERKRLARLEKKNQLKKEGKLLSAKAKDEKRKKELYLQQLKESGITFDTVEKPKQVVQIENSNLKQLLKKKKKGTATKNEDQVKKETQKSDSTKVNGVNGINTNEKQEGNKEEKTEEVVEDWEEFLEEEGNEEETKIKNNNNNNNNNKEKEIKNDTKNKSEMKTAKESKELKGKLGKKKNQVEEKEEDEFIYRSSIVCILGHVDTGKTKLLDKLRHTNVQDNEAGGITQQIGATFFPKDILDAQIHKIDKDIQCMSQGLMIIDTPGHESFYNLRKRGSSLCDIAILVVDLMHGLEQQTKESIQILKQRNCPFVIALNKIDRLYEWERHDWEPFNETFEKQKSYTKDEFEDRLQKIQNELLEQGLNCELYWKNTNLRSYVSIVPTSAITGEGVPDLIMILVKLTQTFMLKNIKYQDKLECTVLEVKNIEGLGTTIDVILTNGVLHESDTIVLCGMNGPITTVIRALLTPQPMKELRIKNEYIHHKSIKACMGLKISANNLDEVLCGTSLFVANTPEEVEEYKKRVMIDVSDVFSHVDKSGVGLYVMASTLGSLEALLVFLNDSKIPVFGVNIGTVQKKDVKKASIMREKGRPEYAVILAFDVKIDAEAEKEAQILGVEIMAKDIIYHLFDQFTEYLKKIEEEKKQTKIADAIFPCELEIIGDCVFNKRDPIVMGVRIVNGILKMGTPLYIPEKSLKIGHVVSLELNKKPVDKAKKGQEVCIKVCGEPHVTFGRHFDASQKVYSKITRESIDVLKEYFRNELTMEDWKLVVQLKKIYSIL